MITLYTFGPALGLPDPSPFVMKAEVLLKMSGLPYHTNTHGFRRAPKGKLPYLESDGFTIADSSFIRLYLERQHGVNFDGDYGAPELGVAWAVEKMLEEHLYFAMVHTRWMIDANFQRGPANFFKRIPLPMRPVIAKLVRSKVAAMLKAQGMGRHSGEEIVELAKRDLDALAAILGDKPYLLGDSPCGADASAYAFVAGVLCPVIDSPIRTHAERHQNLRAYHERMRERFYP